MTNQRPPALVAYPRKNYKAAAALLSALAAAGLATSATAQSVIGRANSNAAFDTGAAWTGGVAPTSSEIAGFSSINTATSATSTISANVNFQIAGITYTNNPGTNLQISGNSGSSLTLGASGINLANGERVLTINTTAPVSLSANQTWTTGTAAASTSQIVVNSVISGSGRLTIEGTAGSPLSPVYLNALNTFTGGVILNAGSSLRLHNTGPVVSGGNVTSSSIGTGNLTINGGTIFGASSSAVVAPTTTVTGNFAVNSAISALNGRYTHGGGNLDLSGGTRTVSLGRFLTGANSLVGGNESFRFLQSSGAPSINVTNGTIRFVRGSEGTASDYTTVNFGAGSTFASGSGFTIGQNVITTFATGNPFGTTGGAQPNVTVESGGFFNLSDASNSRAPQIRSLSGDGVVTNLANVSTTATLTINPQQNDVSTFSGVIANGSSYGSALGLTTSGVVAITKTGLGTQILAGANTYSGATTISEGTLAIGANNALSPNSAISLTGNTAVLDMRSFSAGAASLAASNGATVSFDLGTPGNETALLALSGALTRTGSATLLFDLNGGSLGTYTLLSFASTTFTSASQFSALLAPGYAGDFILGANSLSFQITAIPEPSAFAALAGLAGLGFAASRRRRRA